MLKRIPGPIGLLELLTRLVRVKNVFSRAPMDQALRDELVTRKKPGKARRG